MSQPLRSFESVVFENNTRKSIEMLKGIIELHEGHIILYDVYYADFEVAEKDEKEYGFKKVANQLRDISTFYLKSAVVGCIKYWYDKTECWGVEILTTDSADSAEPCFKTEEEANVFFIELKAWILRK